MTSTLHFSKDRTIKKLVPVGEELGRTRLMSGIDCLALTLAWTRTRGSTMVLQMIFGITASSVSTYLRFGVSTYLRFGRRILIMVLSGQAEARLEVPCAEKIQEYKGSVKAKY